MKVCLINGSPKPDKSASATILAALKERLGDSIECMEFNAARQYNFAEFARGSEALVFAFPLYVDGIPSHLLRLLDENRCGFEGQTVYAIVNNGFYEGEQNLIAIEIMRHWAQKAELRWGKGIGVGAGGMTNAAPIGKGPMARLGRAMDELAIDIAGLRQSRDYVFQPAFPRLMYKTAAHLGWHRMARANGVGRRDIKHKTANDY